LNKKKYVSYSCVFELKKKPVLKVLGRIVYITEIVKVQQVAFYW